MLKTVITTKNLFIAMTKRIDGTNSRPGQSTCFEATKPFPDDVSVAKGFIEPKNYLE